MHYGSADWKTRMSLVAGKKGTKKELEKYGSSLFCVRYRYNAKLKQRIKTVEIVVSEAPWITSKDMPRKYFLMRFREPDGTEVLYLIETHLLLPSVIAKMFDHPELGKYTPLDWVSVSECIDAERVPVEIQRLVIM